MSYRPPNWTNAPNITTVMVLFPGQPQTAQYNAQGISVTLPTNPTRYIFDAMLRASHNQVVTPTKHPVQTGGAISDHAFIEPAMLILDIGMSDAMDAYEQNVWIGGPTKSTSAFQILLAMAFARIPVIVVTKYRVYSNMLVQVLEAEDTAETYAGLRARVTFHQIFVADTQTQPDSARVQDTQTNSFGVKNPSDPTQAQVSKNQVPATVPAVNCPGSGVPGTSDCWSSNSVSGLGPVASH